jgi:hypothetical protein
LISRRHNWLSCIELLRFFAEFILNWGTFFDRLRMSGKRAEIATSFNRRTRTDREESPNNLDRSAFDTRKFFPSESEGLKEA